MADIDFNQELQTIMAIFYSPTTIKNLNLNFQELRATLEEEKEEGMLTVEDKQYKQLVGQGIIL